MRRLGGIPAAVAQRFLSLSAAQSFLRLDKSQTFTATQKSQGLGNLGAQSALGFTPPRQGKGPDQDPNHTVDIGLGVSVYKLKASVDGADFGSVWTDRDCVFSGGATGYTRLPMGLILQWSEIQGGADRTWVYPTTFPHAVFLPFGSCHALSGSQYVHAVEFADVGLSSATVRPRNASANTISTENSFVAVLGY